MGSGNHSHRSEGIDTWKIGGGLLGLVIFPPFGGWAHLLTSAGMRILSGIQPSGALHLGNYFGMMRPAIELQEQGDAYFFIADYHSMTSLYDAAQRRQNTIDVALDFLACGLNPAHA